MARPAKGTKLYFRKLIDPSRLFKKRNPSSLTERPTRRAFVFNHSAVTSGNRIVTVSDTQILQTIKLTVGAQKR